MFNGIFFVGVIGLLFQPVQAVMDPENGEKSDFEISRPPSQVSSGVGDDSDNNANNLRASMILKRKPSGEWEVVETKVTGSLPLRE